MTNIEVSVIIPCYNASEFIGDLLDSIIPQLNSSVEIILIDDYSTDNTLTILNNRLQGFNNCHVIENSYNQGIGSSRNKGFLASKGNYIWFIDSDDVIKNDSIENILESIKNEEHDVYCYSHTLINTLNNKVNKVIVDEGNCNNFDFLNKVLEKKMTFHLWNKVISRKAIGNTLADEKISILVDKNFILKMLSARKLSFKAIDHDIYTYYLRCGSTVTKLTPKKLKDLQYTFKIFLKQCYDLNNTNINKYLVREKIRFSYQVLKNGGDLEFKLPKIIELINDKISFLDYFKFIYVLANETFKRSDN
ncbi:hypothetical protein BCV44_21980 [Vibrio cyclitrophicus]|uniref:glycosyltransferase family 2 protein n=1 Tax=Vibrio cyclitrophicus TaxID=47951 RepID=UPI000C8521CC|nr:glycosyltransferase family 2 protein [Vibrio cyclitrophicus]PME09858.1 hypothetical protein BCV44_21980 [Vibrio cyclitrophicus]